MKYVVSIIPKSLEEAQALDVSRYAGADIIEWRADVLTKEEVLQIAPVIFETFAGYELIFSLRTKPQAGQSVLPVEDYIGLIKEVQDLYQPDYIDFDYYSYPDALVHLQDFSNLILSYFNYEKVPENIMEIFSQLTSFSPRVVRFCVRPKNQQEVLDVMNFARGFKTLNPQQEFVVLAMGEYGQVTRIFGELFGSSWTSVGVDHQTSPGQLTLADTQTILQLLENNKGE